MVEILAKGPVKSRKKKGWKSYYVSTRHRDIEKTNGNKGELKWFRTLDEAQAAARQLNAAQYTGGVVTDSEAGTIGALVAMEIARFEKRESEQTIGWHHCDNAKRELNRIARLVGANAKASTITPAIIEDIIAADPRTEPVKNKFLKRINSLFDEALDLGWCKTNPARNVVIEKRVVFTEDELDENARSDKFDLADMRKLVAWLLDYDKTETNKKIGAGTWCTGLAVIFHALSGSRPQEVVPLRWRALDFDADKFRIATAKKTCAGGYYIGATKTSKGVRSLPIGPVLAPLLKAWRLRSPFANDDDFVFPRRTGEMYHRYKTWNDLLQRACSELGLKHLTLYSLRHLHASLLLQELGENWFEVADRMGHASADFTRRRYGHHVDDRKKPKENVVGSVLFDTAEPAPAPTTNQVVQFKLKS